MQIYKDEIDIQDKLKDNIVKASCQILPSKTKIDRTKFTSFATEYDRDLYRLYTIMVSAGINKNDDVFTKKELWLAKETPIDKPLNVEHSPRSIIGHITESSMIDDRYEPVDEYEDDFEEDEEMYHLLTGGVIYKHLNSRDEELEKECAKLIEEIDNGEWYVSMECLFSDFDYALIHPVFGKRFIQRNDSTSFLTKYLRIYGGDGNYNGMKIGRVLKGLLFSGKGLVKNPANPNSIILNNVHSFGGAYASLQDLDLINKQGDEDMADDFEAKYNEAQNEIKELKEKLAQADAEQQNKILAAKDAEIAQLNETIAVMKKKMEDMDKEKKEECQKKEDEEKCKASLETELQTARAEVEQLKKEKLIVDRVSILVNAGVDKAEAEKLTERFLGVSDEQFAEIVELQKKIIISASVKEEKVEATEVKTEEVVDDTVLDNAQVEDQTALAIEDGGEDKDTVLLATVGKWVDNILVKENK